MRLDNPLLVQWEYASEERLAKRNAITRTLTAGDNPEEHVFRAVAEARPERFLDVGCGTGELAARVAADLGAEVAGVDTSSRMVELTRQQGVDAAVADAVDLPFADRSFDAVAACWVLYHVPQLERAIGECARVLRPSGRFVAATIGENVPEIWDLVGAGHDDLSFSPENGTAFLERTFHRVERRDVEAELVFPDAAAVRSLVAAHITKAYLAPRVPDFDGEFRATLRHTIFVADEPR
jgi:SAM-dependent methyltransferase